MKSTALLMLLFLFALACKTQTQEKKYAFGDSIFVWAFNLDMYENPNPDAKIVGAIPYGSAVVIVDDSIGKVAYKYKALESKTFAYGYTSPLFYLEGFWVKVNFGGMSGYVFDGYLSKLEPLLRRYNDIDTTIRTWATEVLKLKSDKYERGHDAWTNYFGDSKKVAIRIGHDQMTAFTEIKLKNGTLQEGVMLGLQIFKGEYQFVNFENGVYHFLDGNCHLLVSLKKSDLIIRLSCSC